MRIPSLGARIASYDEPWTWLTDSEICVLLCVKTYGTEFNYNIASKLQYIFTCMFVSPQSMLKHTIIQ